MALASKIQISLGPFQVSEPFRDPDADVLLRSSDNALFRVHKAMLTVGSAFFRDMLALPQPKTEQDDGIIPWDETALVLDRLLRFIYPIEEPAVDKVEELFAIIRAADKWQFEGTRARLLALLLTPQFLQDHAFSIYAFLCVMGYDEKEKTALEASKHDPLSSDVRPFLRYMSAMDLLRLIKHRTHPGKKFNACFVPTGHKKKPFTLRPSASPMVSNMMKFWSESEADLTVVSADGIKFPAVKILLLRSSPVLQKKIVSVPSLSSALNHENRMVFQWDEHASIIAALLHYVYPVSKPNLLFFHIDHIITLAEAASKWDITAAMEPLLDHLLQPHRLASHAIRIYGVLCRLNCEPGRQKALRYAIITPPILHPVRADFKGMSAMELIELVETYEERLAKAKTLVESVGMPSIRRFCSHKKKWIDGTAVMKKLLSEALTHSLCMEALGPTKLIANIAAGLYCVECLPEIGSMLEAALLCVKLDLELVLQKSYGRSGHC